MALSEAEKRKIREAGGNPNAYTSYDQFIRAFLGGSNVKVPTGGSRPSTVTLGNQPKAGSGWQSRSFANRWGDGPGRKGGRGGKGGGGGGGKQGGTGNPQLDAYLEELEALGSEDEVIEFIGGNNLGPRRPGSWGRPSGPWGRPDVAGPYVEGSDFDEIAEMSTEQLVRFQEQLIAMGVLDADSTLIGKRDTVTIDAMNQIMTLANAEGTNWGTMLYELQQIADERGGKLVKDPDAPEFNMPSYLAPDYATMAQKVKDTMRTQLGRDPDESELAALVGELQGWDREAYEAEVAAAESEFNAEYEGGPEGQTFQDVDPLARFNEMFEQKYASELDFVEERDERAPMSQQSVQGAVGTLSDMSRST
jgi:hypothetical protein